MVDNFGINYTHKKDAYHLFSALQAKYKVTQDWTGGILRNKIEVWLQETTTGHLNSRILERHTQQIPEPHPHQTTALTPPVHGTKVWIHSAPDGAPKRRLPGTQSWGSKHIPISCQEFLYYARMVDPTMLVALNTIAPQQSKGTQETTKKLVQLLNYVSTHPEAITIYHARGMTLHMHSDASFLSAPGAKSEKGGITNSLNHQYIQINPPTPPPPQWTNTCGIHNNEKRPSKCNGSGTWSIICYLLERSRPDNCPGGNGTPPTTDTSSHRQHNKRRFFKRQYQTR